MWRYWSEAKVLATAEVEKPRLAVWARRDSKEMADLTTYLKDVEIKLGDLPETGLFLRLEVGVTDPRKLLSSSDLDNYLNPLVKHFGQTKFVLVSGSKRVGVGSRVTVGIAESVEVPMDGWHFCEIPAGRGKDKRERKEEIRRILAECQPTPLPDGPVEVRLNWRCPPPSRVNWVTLWKPTIDAMGTILGEQKRPIVTAPPKPGTIQRNYNPNDGRIVHLTLHRSEDSAPGYGIAVRVWWRPAPIGASS